MKENYQLTAGSFFFWSGANFFWSAGVESGSALSLSEKSRHEALAL